MFLGYNTNGFAHHLLSDAVDVLADLGYRGIGLTADVHTINPLAPNWRERAHRLRKRLADHKMRAVVETGARFLLDPKHKHQPTLLDPDRHKALDRLHFLEACVDLAVEIDEPVVSIWSGTAVEDIKPSILMARLAEACKRLCDFGTHNSIRIAFEPEPGMFVDTMEKYADLAQQVNHPGFGLTLDIGHLVCQGDVPVSDHIQNWASKLWNVHVEDMRRGVHDHLMFGEGEVDFADAFGALHRIKYRGGVYVELSRHSHNAVETAERAKAFLDPLIKPPVETAAEAAPVAVPREPADGPAE